MGYALPAGTSYCRIGDELLFLDIVTDRYFGLGADAKAGFLNLVDGVPPHPSETAALAQLVARGILIGMPEDPTAAPRACSLPSPIGRLWEAGQQSPDRSRVVGALAALLRSELEMRLRSLAAILSSIERLKERGGLSRPTPEWLEPRMRAFEQCDLIVSPHNKCLPHSIAIARSLLASGRRVELVIGVKVRPFRAHCWVQAGEWLINDRLDRIRDFTPILVI